MDIAGTPQAGRLALGALTYGGPATRWRTEAMRSHASARLIHISRGQGRITVAGLTNGYGPNNLVYLPPHTIYGIETGPTVFGHVLQFDGRDDWPTCPVHLRLRDVNPQKEAAALFEAIERELQPQGDKRAAWCHFGLLTVFFERQMRRAEPAPADTRSQTAAARLVAAYTALIARDFGSDRNVAEYAAMLDVTPTHLARCCRKTSGRSALALLNDRIHYEACMMLKTTTVPVAKIAADLGFQSPAYFSRSFQKRSGLTPSDFRKSEINIRQ